MMPELNLKEQSGVSQANKAMVKVSWERKAHEGRRNNPSTAGKGNSRAHTFITCEVHSGLPC